MKVKKYKEWYLLQKEEWIQEFCYGYCGYYTVGDLDKLVGASRIWPFLTGARHRIKLATEIAHIMYAAYMGLDPTQVGKWAYNCTYCG